MIRIIALALITTFVFWGCESDDDNGSTFVGLEVATVTTGPAIDGVGGDAAWDNATSFIMETGTSGEYTNAFGQIDVTLKAVQDDQYVYFLASWADADEDVSKSQWSYHSSGWSQSESEDRLYMMWDTGFNGTEGADCATMCHVGDGQMYTTGGGWVDVWHWKAHRTNPLGHLDDKYFDAEIGSDGGRHGDAKTIGMYSNNKDNGLPLYSGPLTDGHFLIIPAGGDVSGFTAFVDDATTQAMTIPGYILNENADGSRADVEAKGVWNNGFWTLEIKRLLDTDNAGDDVIFVAGNTYQMSFAVTDNSGGDHSGAAPIDVKF
ncbi:MAG: hypothetical protein HQ510_05675 [Candidatus Marinimicrobia bacterium]|nr:hypothetical protein [Candidatus Neomarinimicrobiota bacterium]